MSCTRLDGAAGPAAEARFEAINKAGRGPAWKNRPIVITAEPGRFSRTERLAGTLVWRYLVEPDGDGTRLTESYEVTQPITRLGWFDGPRPATCARSAGVLLRREAPGQPLRCRV